MLQLLLLLMVHLTKNLAMVVTEDMVVMDTEATDMEAMDTEVMDMEATGMEVTDTVATDTEATGMVVTDITNEIVLFANDVS